MFSSSIPLFFLSPQLKPLPFCVHTQTLIRCYAAFLYFSLDIISIGGHFNKTNLLSCFFFFSVPPCRRYITRLLTRSLSLSRLFSICDVELVCVSPNVYFPSWRDIAAWITTWVIPRFPPFCVCAPMYFPIIRPLKPCALNAIVPFITYKQKKNRQLLRCSSFSLSCIDRERWREKEKKKKTHKMMKSYRKRKNESYWWWWGRWWSFRSETNRHLHIDECKGAIYTHRHTPDRHHPRCERKKTDTAQSTGKL